MGIGICRFGSAFFKLGIGIGIGIGIGTGISLQLVLMWDWLVQVFRVLVFRVLMVLSNCIRHGLREM